MTTKKIPTRPARQVCSLCATDELTYQALGDGLWQLRCPACRDGEGRPRIWQCDLKSEIEVPGGQMAELGLFDDLPKCLVAGEPWVEHGVVEDRYRRLRPDVYADLLERYRHTAFGPKRYTTSSFIASALGALSRNSEILFLGGQRATGFWSYNRHVGHWALAPAPPVDSVLTWEAYAPTVDIDPNTWPIPLPGSD